MCLTFHPDLSPWIVEEVARCAAHSTKWLAAFLQALPEESRNKPISFHPFHAHRNIAYSFDRGWQPSMAESNDA